MILKCDCQHPYQDRVYGSGLRAHNPLAAPFPQKYRCTVCGHIREKS